jgi:hypothetical protein
MTPMTYQTCYLQRGLGSECWVMRQTGGLGVQIPMNANCAMRVPAIRLSGASEIFPGDIADFQG